MNYKRIITIIGFNRAVFKINYMIRIVIIIVLFSFTVHSQNWNVFNKSYRYNYKFNNSPLISNVLFVDTVKQIGADTVYLMNNIGKVNYDTIFARIPQFLMMKIIKKANGNVKFEDTTNITIIPTCTLNQSWLFDSNYSLNATCVAITTQTIFNQIDSLKIIVVNSIDTIKFSKSYGIIQYPEIYGKNKYYKLVGIEKAKNYQKTPWIGEKVPNAWDFYDYQIGKEWCEQRTYKNINESCGNTFNCYKKTFTVNSKTITPTGYIYGVTIKHLASALSYTWCSFNSSPVNTYSTEIFFDNLDSTLWAENKLYPGMITEIPAYWWTSVARFGLSNNNSFSKIFGNVSNSAFVSITPSISLIGQAYHWESPGVYTVCTDGYDEVECLYTVGNGLRFMVHRHFNNQEILSSGCNVFVGVQQYLEEEASLFYPNPANNKLFVTGKNFKIKIRDLANKLLIETEVDNSHSLDVSNLPNGIYFVEIQNDSGKYSQKLLIQH
jgi:hypothetical protein